MGQYNHDEEHGKIREVVTDETGTTTRDTYWKNGIDTKEPCDFSDVLPLVDEG